MFRLFFTVMITSSLNMIYAQQGEETSLYWNTLSAINPATSGIQYKHEGLLHYGFRSNSTSESLLGIYNTNFKQHGAGLLYRYNHIGFMGSQYIKGSYNYQLSLNDGSKLSFGTAINFQTHQIDWSEAIPPVPYDNYRGVSLNTDFGLVYMNENFFTGISVNQITISHFSKETNDAGFYDPVPVLNAHFRYLFNLNSSLQLFPQMLLSTDFINIASQFNLNISYNNFINVGLVYSPSARVGANLSISFLDRYSFAYQHTFLPNVLSSLGNFGDNTFQLIIRIPNNSK